MPKLRRYKCRKHGGFFKHNAYLPEKARICPCCLREHPELLQQYEEALRCSR